MSLLDEVSQLSGYTYRRLVEVAELLEQTGMPLHASDVRQLADRHMKQCLELAEITDPGYERKN